MLYLNIKLHSNYYKVFKKKIIWLISNFKKRNLNVLFYNK